jgi:heme exporter protein D
MHWSSWSEFWSMGGYGLYVWGSYGVTFLLLGGEVIAVLKRKRSLANRGTQRDRLETPGAEFEATSLR